MGKIKKQDLLEFEDSIYQMRLWSTKVLDSIKKELEKMEDNNGI